MYIAMCTMSCRLFILYCTLCQIILRHSHHPPILQDTSWTLAVPFKEQCHHRTPSESIGNNYSPRARHLKIQNLQKRTRTLSDPHGEALVPRILSSFPCLDLSPTVWFGIDKLCLASLDKLLKVICVWQQTAEVFDLNLLVTASTPAEKKRKVLPTGR